MALFDVYIAKVFYEDGEKFKLRPVVQVMEDTSDPNAFAVVTSNLTRTAPEEVRLVDHEHCGLSKPSVVRLGHRLSSPKYKKKVGSLSTEDRMKILTVAKLKHKIHRHKTEDLDDNFDWSGFND